ncbi:MFS transporter [Oceanirhabdus sp. W0125-5]|uniref:MFS transporter n=1 Tax=Oceanirhabdus sp. W0125-5 TaxID=2999116 RepID=UPI0022F32F70|nr:glycoside-pentoside-hexuronide (GPH):cation symporter [Oceanirhabdus sp. W0125-5]WBW95649.1 glycoside-pentoside-hexuronide (GPH):cation symporter [Oceanirhabdus sp. W0125-5]
MENQKMGRVSGGEKFTYSLGAVAQNMFFAVPMMYLVFFYTDVFGISAAAVGTLLLVSRIWDAINDPMMGAIVDRTNTKRGKFRPYIIWGSIPLAISFILIFAGPSSLGATSKIVYAYVTYIFFGMMYTMVNVPYNAVSSSMTQDSKERTSIVTLRQLFSNFGMLIGIAAIMPLVGILGKGNQSKGFAITALLLGIFGMVINFISGVKVKERVSSGSKEKYSVKDMINIMKTNLPLFLISMTYMVNSIATTVRSAATAYYFSYNVGKTELIGIVSGLTLLCTLVGTGIVPMFTKRLGKKKAMYIGLIIMIISSASIYFISNQNITMLIVMFAINGLASAFAMVLPWIMLNDTVEYSEWKTGIRPEGLVFSTFTFASKFASAVGGALLGYLLQVSGYVANATQTPEALTAIKVSISGIPALAAIIALILMMFYKLDEKMYNNILKEIKERKSQSA